MITHTTDLERAQAAEIERLTKAQRLTDEQITQALRRAYYLGQTYWQQADSEFTSEHRKADATSAKFNALIAETIAAAQKEQRSKANNPLHGQVAACFVAPGALDGIGVLGRGYVD